MLPLRVPLVASSCCCCCCCSYRLAAALPAPPERNGTPGGVVVDRPAGRCQAKARDGRGTRRVALTRARRRGVSGQYNGMTRRRLVCGQATQGAIPHRGYFDDPAPPGNEQERGGGTSL